jgi:hypothetical protein
MSLIQDIKDNTYIGQYVDLYGVPNDGSFVMSGRTLLRSEYPELAALYPQVPAAGTVTPEVLRTVDTSGATTRI